MKIREIIKLLAADGWYLVARQTISNIIIQPNQAE
ncbi:Uncharacterised protein [uncultured archaeon]|nr:Uncharacterised protein [uncultured archaeon]